MQHDPAVRQPPDGPFSLLFEKESLKTVCPHSLNEKCAF
jgi:hypothetical protein